MSVPVIVDSHIHVYRSKGEGRQAKQGYEIWEYGPGGNPRLADWSGDEEEAVAAMTAADVDYAVVTNMLDRVPVDADAGDELVAFNEWLCDLARRRPQFIPLLAVDPGCLPVPELVSHIRHMVWERGATGIKLHPPVHRLNLGDEGLWPIFELCQDLDLRIVSHSGPSRAGHQYGEPNAFRPLLDAFPRLRLVMAHLGGAAWRQIPRIAEEYPDVYFDCCEIIEWTGAARAPSGHELSELIRAIGPGRVMMGSDFPWYDMGRTIDLVRGLPDLSDAEREGIVGANAVRFFGLRVGARPA
jgi:uncharacterized protein